MNDTLRRTKSFVRRYWLILAIVVIVLSIVASLASGYRLGPGLTLVQSGELQLQNLPQGAIVYVDAARRGTARSVGSFTLSMVPGSHTVIVDAPGREPWTDLVSVAASETTVVTPILVATSPVREILKGEEVARAIVALKAAVLPSQAKPLSLLSGCSSLSVTQNRLIAVGTTTASCTPPEYLCSEGECAPTLIYKPVKTIRSIIAHPSRADAVIISYEGIVGVLELDPREPQYFAPLYEGEQPTAFAWKEGTIGIQDRTTFYQLALP